MTPEKLVLVTGGTGYVGGCLIPHLLEKGCKVRVLVLDPARLFGRFWLSQVEVVEGNVLSPEVLDQAMQGVSTAYYLVHSMASGRNYVGREIDSARNFASAAAAAGVQHIIYLGGLADPGDDIGLHLRSRLQTGDILRQGSVPVTEFRASLIIGSGSISFELIRYPTEQFPILFGPLWMHNRTQPIAIQNVLDYLLSALECQTCRGKIYEIGGKDVLTYLETMSVYARLRGLKRRIVAVPGMSVNLIALLAGILSPVPARIARPLLGGMRSDSVVRDHAANLDFPLIHPMNYETAVLQALSRLSPGCLESAWEKGASSFRIKKEGFFIVGQQLRLQVQPEAVYRAITSLGGRVGWLYLNWLWKLRAFLDKLLGGPGLRGRSSDDRLAEGDPLDFYRVEKLVPGSMLRLKAELKAPGQGWMEWSVQPHPDGGSILSQIVYFVPRGVPGFLYWYMLYPVHTLVFTGLLKALAGRAGELQNQSSDPRLSRKGDLS